MKRFTPCMLALGLLVVASACEQQSSQAKDVLLVRLASGPISIDGLLDESAWNEAASSGPLRRFDGKADASQASLVRIIRTDQALIFGFDCRDEDIRAPYKKRDDPLYLQEAVEVFIDMDADRGDYMEFEVSPNGVLFDAAFSGRRQGMDLSFNPEVQVATRIDGSLNQSADRDAGWTAELAIPFTEMVGRGRRPPKAGDCWRANIFRLDKNKTGSQSMAWQPTAGDFHDLNAFGRLCF
jgi:hypothetical protein